MTFWAYMLHCADRSFYVGHTDDLERRIGQHQTGAIPGYTSDRLPVVHVWSQVFETREEARSAETQIKGWSRAKKMALIRSDWLTICNLARGRKGGASTSSAESVGSADVFLHPHPQALPSQDYCLGVTIRRTRSGIWLRYRVTGECRKIRWPGLRSPGRTDGLWKHTCFEMFTKRTGAESYSEYNFSPSTAWAAYHFDGYRSGMSDLEQAVCDSRTTVGPFVFEILVKVSISDPIASLAIALSAVIEETDGTKSYWALKHPPGPPDFHHPDCFALTLAAAG